MEGRTGLNDEGVMAKNPESDTRGGEIRSPSLIRHSYCSKEKKESKIHLPVLQSEL